ncbi:hypothetical protein FRB96_003907 [Tulasnella sp. 330]|nr:hypothetical protein FRB96_003907 [Tulasnella sp. 330]
MPFAPRPPRGSPYMAGAFGIPIPPKGDINMEDYRANSLNQPMRFRDVLKSGKTIVGTAIALASVPAARITATLGFDWVFIDAEHTPMGPETLIELIKTVNYYSEGAMAPVVRLPTHGSVVPLIPQPIEANNIDQCNPTSPFRHEWIAWALDAGAAGIILPHTETAEQARKVVNAARFAPHGDRSFPPFAQTYGYTDGTPEGVSLLDMWSNNAAVIMQLESAEAVKNAAEICAVPGVDAIMIGTGDLRLSMRLPFGFDGAEPEFLSAIETIENEAKKNNLPLVGFALGPPAVEAKLKRGYQMLMVSADMIALIAGQSGGLGMARSVITDFKKADTKKVEGVKGHGAGKPVVNGQ